MEIVKQRHAAKAFDGRKVPQEQIEELTELIRLAPSSINLQPWRAMVIEDAERKEALLEHSWNQPSITSCSHLFVFCANIDFDPLLDRLESRMSESGTSPEKVAGYMEISRGFIASLQGKLPWAQRQTFIALTHGLLGAQSLGIDSCPMEGFVPEKYSEILGLPKTLVPTVLMPIGYATNKPYPKVRFTRDEMFFESV